MTDSSTRPKARVPIIRTTTDGQEKFCRRCNEWWPADLEFFYSDPSGALGLFYCCKACYRDMDKRPGRELPDQASMIPTSTMDVMQNFGGYQ